MVERLSVEQNVGGSIPLSHPKEIHMKQYLTIAIQKQGRLTDETIDFLRRCGFSFERSSRQLFSWCRNFPIQILYVRDDDIPRFVESGVVDAGIVGQNLLTEMRPQVKKLLNLRFGFCSLVVAVPKASPITSVKDLEEKTIATSYPVSTKKFMQTQNICANLTEVAGAVEITPMLGVADAIVDLTATGSTFAVNDLRIIATIAPSEAILITNKALPLPKQALLSQLLTRAKSVLSASQYAYISIDMPETTLPIVKKIIPGLKNSISMPLIRSKWICLQAVIKNELLWNSVDKLKASGIKTITVLPIERIIT